MTPIGSPRSRFWPWLALPCALTAAWMTTAVGFAHDEPPRSALHEAPRPAGSPDSSRGPTAMGADQDQNDDLDLTLSFEVRIFDRVSSPWTELVSRLPKVLDERSGDSGWTLDVSDLKAMLLRVQADPSFTVLQAPRVTVFEGDRGTVTTPSALPVAAADKGRSVTVSGTPGEGRTPTQGTTVRFSGDRLKQGTRITIEVSESWPAPDAGTSQSGGPSRQVRLEAIALPSGHSLAVDLGRKRRDVGAVSLICDRLVVIRPRRVANEPDALPTVSPSTRIPRHVGATP